MAGTVTASVVKNDTTSPPAFQNSAGTEIGQLCRAWVNFNGYSGASPVIRASFNVSSVTYSSAGVYVVNFTNAFTDANYAVAATAGGTSQSGAGTKFWVNVSNNADSTPPTTTTLTIAVGYADTVFTAVSRINVSVFR